MYEKISLIHSKTCDKLDPEHAVLCSRDDYPYITTKNFISKKIYYEITHLNGKNCYLAGFCLQDAGTMYLYPMCSDKYISIFSENNIKFSINNFESIPLDNLGYNYTIGMSVDPFLHIFSIYYQEQILSFNYSTTSYSTKISPAFREQYASGDSKDEISINFGSHPFRYQPPENYYPWQDKFISIKSLIINCSNILILIFTYSILS